MRSARLGTKPPLATVSKLAAGNAWMSSAIHYVASLLKHMSLGTVDWQLIAQDCALQDTCRGPERLHRKHLRMVHRKNRPCLVKCAYSRGLHGTARSNRRALWSHGHPLRATGAFWVANVPRAPHWEGAVAQVSGGEGRCFRLNYNPTSQRTATAQAVPQPRLFLD